MVTYLMLFRYTDHGIRTLRHSPERVAAAKTTFDQMGVTVKNFYLLLGRFDTVFIVQAPDDAAVAKAAVALSAQGNVRTEPLRAFNEDEFRRMVTELPPPSV